MERMLLRVHQARIFDLCEGAIIAIGDINGFKSIQSGRFWYGMQNFVVAAGNLSKSFFGSGPEPKRTAIYEARRPLRESLQVDDSSPFKKVVIRNDLEHLDERIDEWWADTPRRNFMDAIVGPREGVIQADEGSFGEKDKMRWFDPETGNLIFWGNELHVPSVAEEVQRILPLAQTERIKPHWEPGDGGSVGPAPPGG